MCPLKSSAGVPFMKLANVCCARLLHRRACFAAGKDIATNGTSNLWLFQARNFKFLAACKAIIFGSQTSTSNKECCAAPSKYVRKKSQLIFCFFCALGHQSTWPVMCTLPSSDLSLPTAPCFHLENSSHFLDLDQCGPTY